MLKYVALALVAVAGATPALAQDAAPFTGFHVEGLLGFDRVDASGIVQEDGLVFGGVAGYDFNAGSVILGVEGEATLATTKECFAIAVGETLCLKAKRDLYAGARAGFPVGPRTLIYIKGGYTNARVQAVETIGATVTTDETNLDGLRGGAGVEQRLGDHAFVKVEYRYSNYEGDVVRHQGVVGLGLRF